MIKEFNILTEAGQLVYTITKTHETIRRNSHDLQVSSEPTVDVSFEG